MSDGPVIKLVLELIGAIGLSIVASYLYERFGTNWRSKATRATKAHEKLIHWLLPMAYQNHLPDARQFHRLMESLAQQFKVPSAALWSLSEAASKLIAEILDDRGQSGEDKSLASSYVMIWESDQLEEYRKIRPPSSSGGALPASDSVSPRPSIINFSVVCFQTAFTLGLLWHSGQFWDRYVAVAITLVLGPVVVWIVAYLIEKLVGVFASKAGPDSKP